MKLKVIAYARNGHTDKFGIPRQSREESPILTRIVFEPEYNVREALRGIEGFSHLWLLWGFHKDRFADRVQTDNSDRVQTDNAGELSWSPTVRPPRLGGNKRMGVFATRSPFRPNPIGLSSVKLLKVQSDKAQGGKDSRLELIVSGADMLDGTPIYDIKPYLSFSDSHPEAVCGFAEQSANYELRIANDGLGMTNDGFADVPEDVWRDIQYILRQDPRPAYQDDPEREYKMDYAGFRVTFVVENGTIFVKKIEKM